MSCSCFEGEKNPSDIQQIESYVNMSFLIYLGQQFDSSYPDTGLLRSQLYLDILGQNSHTSLPPGIHSSFIENEDNFLNHITC